MTESVPPLVVDGQDLAPRLGEPALVVVDLSQAEGYATAHVPGAVHMEYALLNASRPPVGGLLPERGILEGVLSDAGISPETWVVAYDGEGGGKASRLLWTLDVLGHRRKSLLDGGMHAWLGAGRPTAQGVEPGGEGRYTASADGRGHCDKDYILARLDDASVRLLDTRTPEEYHGANVRAARGGHIPGAVNFNWIEAMDQTRDLRLKAPGDLLEALDTLGVGPEHEVIAYCHTHHRSSHTYWTLRWLGFERVLGYAGAWSEWGNDPALPIEAP